MKGYFLIILAIYFPEFGFCQKADSLDALKPHRFLRSIVAPTALVAGGMIVKNHNENIQRYFNQKIDERGPRGPSNISDYTQFAPMAVVFLASAMHKKGEHKFVKQVVLAAEAEALMIGMVRPLKFFTAETRPDGGSHSFPSGHTAQAFMAATFLHKELGRKSVWYSIAGYTMATGVGMCRVASNRHWASDVLVGAGVGVLSTNLVYLVHRHRSTPRRMNVAAAPTGFYMSMKL